MIALLDIVLQGRYTPRLIKWRPGDDRWVVDIPFHSFGPLTGKPINIFSTELVGICHLAPDEEAHPICPVVEARIFDLLVLATSIESEFLCQLDVRLQRL